MTRELIHDKINYYFNQQKKVHLTKLPTGKFPKGKFHNGLICQVYNDFILFGDIVEGNVEIPNFEIADIEEFKSG